MLGEKDGDIDMIEGTVDGRVDVLFGNVGNDVLYGEGGNDSLNGSSFQAVGAYEQDVLSGGEGRDRFILGNSIQAFYTAAESGDYARITDFNIEEDQLQLHGAASKYTQTQQNGNIHLFYGEEVSELVAILENQSTKLDLETAANFV